MFVKKTGEAMKTRSMTETFEGGVWATQIMGNVDSSPRVQDVYFSPCSRTHWHYHEGGQLLLVLRGNGLICAQGETPQKVTAGDVVWTPPGERHWHGADVDTFLAHTAVSLGETIWLEPVDDDAYAPTGTGATGVER